MAISVLEHEKLPTKLVLEHEKLPYVFGAALVKTPLCFWCYDIYNNQKLLHMIVE